MLGFRIGRPAPIRGWTRGHVARDVFELSRKKKEKRKKRCWVATFVGYRAQNVGFERVVVLFRPLLY